MGSCIAYILQFVAQHAADHLVVRIYEFFRCKVFPRKAAKIQSFLAKLGATNEQHIREIVEDWTRDRRLKLDAPQTEELIALLTNLCRGSLFLSTQGIPRSSHVRSQQLLEQLLNNIQPTLRQGDPVAAGHDWKLHRFLGMGSYGEVWSAVNPGHPDKRAYKFFTKEESQQWFAREQKSLVQIQKKLAGNPNIIGYIDVVNNKECPFLVLEYAGGGSLEDWLLEDNDRRAELRISDAIDSLIKGMAAAHEVGVTHRDLKPANIILTDEPKHPQVRITDFGLAHVDDGGSAASATASLSVGVGTPLYQPPEAQTGYFDQVDPAKSDVFALGVIWYQLLINKLERPHYDFADQLRDRAVDTHAIRVISRCLANPERRYANAIELQSDLNELVPLQTEIPAGQFDVQYIAREYFSRKAGV